MTYPPQRHQPVYSPTVPTGGPPKRRMHPAVIVATVLGVIAAASIAAAAYVILGGTAPAASDKLTEVGAQRACRIAVEEEWRARNAEADTGAAGIVSSVQKVELLDTWESDGGYRVDANVHYTLTSGIVAPVADTINLTCTATGTDSKPATKVANR